MKRTEPETRRRPLWRDRGIGSIAGAFTLLVGIAAVAVGIARHRLKSATATQRQAGEARGRAALTPPVRRAGLPRAPQRTRAARPARGGWGQVAALGRYLPRAASIAALGGLLFTATQIVNERAATERQLRNADAQTANAIFSQAITALGDDNLAIRVGGVYALQQLASDSRRDHWRALEVLSAYLDQAIPWQDDGAATPRGGARPIRDLPEDVQAILSVLSQRRTDWDEGRRLDLADLDLRGANLVGINLANADLSYSHLAGADLTRAELPDALLVAAHLEGATLTEANLRGALLASARLSFALLTAAHLEGANLSDAQLDFALLSGAHLEGADLARARLTGANLSGAHLEGADLETTTGLTASQISSAIIDQTTRLPPGREPPSDATAAP